MTLTTTLTILTRRPTGTLVVALAVGLAVGLVVRLAAPRATPRAARRREGFFPALIPLISLGITAAGVGAKVTGLDKKVQDKIWKKGDKYVPTYTGRVQDGAEWSCPNDTVETGNPDDGKACMNSQFHAPVWKAGPDGKWAHLCPNGTAPTKEDVWERKCEVGWTQRVLAGGKWACPEGTTDTGKTWDNSDWHEAHKQCKRSRAYTTRVSRDNKWVCPEGTKDTGRGWSSPSNQADQCKFTGP